MSAELDVFFDRSESLARQPRTVLELPGGLTNRNYKVTTPDGVFVARFSSGGSELLASERNIPRIAAACRRLHEGTRFGNDFDMFDIQRRYRAVARSRGFRIPDGYDDLAPQLAAAEQALAASARGPGAADTVPCNNDLLAANFIDDGERIWLIDYELSGNNDPCFELGNIAAESHLSRDGLAELVRSYFGRPRPSRTARAWLLGGLVGMYGWTLWGSIQHGASPIDYDFWGWAMERFEGAARGFTGRDFGELLENVQRDD